MKIGNSKPINKTAALVIGKGEQYKSPKKINAKHSYAPIKTRPITLNELNAEGFIDLTSHKVGRLTVVGLSAEKPGRWVCRCSCGMYTERKSKAIKNKNNYVDMCEECRHLVWLKRAEHYRRTGVDKDIDKFI